MRFLFAIAAVATAAPAFATEVGAGFSVGKDGMIVDQGSEGFAAFGSASVAGLGWQAAASNAATRWSARSGRSAAPLAADEAVASAAATRVWTVTPSETADIWIRLITRTSVSLGAGRTDAERRALGAAATAGAPLGVVRPVDLAAAESAVSLQATNVNGLGGGVLTVGNGVTDYEKWFRTADGAGDNSLRYSGVTGTLQAELISGSTIGASWGPDFYGAGFSYRDTVVLQLGMFAGEEYRLQMITGCYTSVYAHFDANRLGDYGPTCAQEVFWGGVLMATDANGDAIEGFTLIGDDGHDYALADPRASVVPEPGTWALMIAGFGLVGMALRRRRTRCATRRRVRVV